MNSLKKNCFCFLIDNKTLLVDIPVKNSANSQTYFKAYAKFSLFFSTS